MLNKGSKLRLINNFSQQLTQILTPIHNKLSLIF